MESKGLAKGALRVGLFFAVGAALGVASRMFDLFTRDLGNIFSELSIWILLGTVIAIFSATPKRAGANVFAFCVGMLAAYYATAMATHGVYSKTFVVGWSVFTLFCPLFAWITWHAKEKKPIAAVISVGILVVTLLVSMVLFDGPRLYDILIELLLAYFLFFQKVKRGSVPSHKKAPKQGIQ